MKVLVVKMSSLGDVIHTLPALGDATAALPGISFDWVVEEAFAEIPCWHRAVDRVIPVAIRRWRKHPLRAFTGPEWRAVRSALRERPYDAVIDAQGLLKSALITRLVRAPRYGMDRASAREGLAALACDHRIHVPRELHAVERTRLLFALALSYSMPETMGDYGLQDTFADDREAGSTPAALMFFHGTARAEKLWPEDHWVTLAGLAGAAGYGVRLPWGNEEERQRARRIAARADNAEVLPRLSLRELGGCCARRTARLPWIRAWVISVLPWMCPLSRFTGLPIPSLSVPMGATRYISSRLCCAPGRRRPCSPDRGVAIRLTPLP